MASSLRPFRLPLALGLLLALFWSALSLGGVLARPEWVLYHGLFEARGPQARPKGPEGGPGVRNPFGFLYPSNLTVVGIDEASLEDLGVWPPPRTVFADLIDGLLDAGAAVVALDVVFPQAQSAETDQAL
jgi:CHASE2 domain-containing sensor protein